MAGERILVVGGTSGIGYVCAQHYAAHGAAKIALIGRNKGRGRQAAQDLEGVEALFYAGDASDQPSIEVAVKQAAEDMGGIDVLLVTAGGNPMPTIFQKMDPATIAPTLNNLLLSVIYSAHAALPFMTEQQSGNMVFVASDAGKVATPGESVIGAAMAGIIMFTRTLAIENKRHNVRANVITPSIVQDTGLYEDLMGNSFAGKLFAKAERMAELGVTQPQDIAELCTFLTSNVASKMTGQAISVNGGISAA